MKRRAAIFERGAISKEGAMIRCLGRRFLPVIAVFLSSCLCLCVPLTRVDARILRYDAHLPAVLWGGQHLALSRADSHPHHEASRSTGLSVHRSQVPRSIGETSVFLERILCASARPSSPSPVDIDAGRREVAAAATACFDRRRASTYPPSHIASQIGQSIRPGQALTVVPHPGTEESPAREVQPVRIRLGPYLGSGTFGAVFAVSLLDGGQQYAMKILVMPTEMLPTEMYIKRSLCGLVQKELQVIQLFQGMSESSIREARVAAPLFAGTIQEAPEPFPAGEHKRASRVAVFAPLMSCDIWHLDPSSCLSNLSVHALTHLTQAMLRAVAGLHGYGLVHRDIKADNFLVDSNGDVFIADLAFTVRPGSPGKRIGPAFYADPDTATALWGPHRQQEEAEERARAYGVEPPPKKKKPPLIATKASDAWALGIVLYEMWCGALPWDMGTILSPVSVTEALYRTADAKRQRKPLQFDECRTPHGIPGKIKELIAALLCFEQERRLLPEDALGWFPLTDNGGPASEVQDV